MALRILAATAAITLGLWSQPTPSAKAMFYDSTSAAGGFGIHYWLETESGIRVHWW